MVVLVNRAKMTTSTTGTGTITLGSVVDGYQTFAAAGVSNGDSVRYVIEDGTSNWEIGSGTYTASGTTLSRTPSESSGGGSAIDLSGDAIVFISAIASDIQPITYVSTTFTATAGQTAFTVSYTAGLVEVFLNGAKLSAADFTATNGTSVVLASGANVGDTVDVVAYGTVSVSNTYTQAQANALFVDVAGDTMTGALNVQGTVTADAYALDSIALPSAGTAAIFNRNTDNNLYIQTDSGNTVYLLDGSQNTMYGASTTSHIFQISNAEKMRISSSGSVGIGTSSPSDKFHVDGAGAFVRVNRTDGEAGITLMYNGSNSTRSNIATQTNGDLAIDTANTERMRIDSSGNTTFKTSAGHLSVEALGGGSVKLNSNGSMGMNVAAGYSYEIGVGGSEVMRIDSNGALLLGTTSRSIYYNSVNAYNASAVIKTNVSNEVADLVITNGNNDFGSSVDFARTNSAGNDVRFATISAQPTNNTAGSEAGVIRFYTKDTGDSNVVERMRLDASGNLLVGTTSANANGITLNSGDYIYASRDGGQALFVNRDTSDGTLIDLRKSGSTVGSIGSAGSGTELYIAGSGANTSGIYFNAANQTIPMKAGSLSDATQDLGKTNFRWKDLHLSGKAYDGNGNLRAIPRTGSEKTSSYTLTTSDVGLYVQVGSGGSITVPNSTFSTGDAVSIFNNTSGDRTITLSISTAYIAGTDGDVNSVTLATRGVCTILFISGTVCVVSGNVS